MKIKVRSEWEENPDARDICANPCFGAIICPKWRKKGVNDRDWGHFIMRGVAKGLDA